MNTERHYPVVYKFTSVCLMAFAVYVFHRTSNMMIKLYSAIEFLATLNGWAASENDDMEYGDLYLLIDGLCAACYFLTLLDLYNDIYQNFFLYSIVIFFLYMLWNLLLIIKQPSLKISLRKYQICNASAGIYSLFAFLMVRYSNDNNLVIFVQYIGMILWIAVLLVWYYDFYFVEFKGKSKKTTKRN